jgi:hypothetical protein
MNAPVPDLLPAQLWFYMSYLRVALYLMAATYYGYFRDELYNLACGEHLGWGYVDQPPLIGWMAWLLQHTIGTALYALRLLPLLAHTGTIVLTAAMAHDLGGTGTARSRLLPFASPRGTENNCYWRAQLRPSRSDRFLRAKVRVAKSDLCPSELLVLGTSPILGREHHSCE